MGTYIGMGMVGEYIIPKKELAKRLQREFIPTKTDDEIRKEIRKILPAELYKLEENEGCYDFTLVDDVSPNVSIRRSTYFSLIRCDLTLSH